jgi:hypothetical protein
MDTGDPNTPPTHLTDALPRRRTSAHATPVVFRAAALAGAISAFVGIIGSQAAETLCTGDWFYFLLVVGALVLGELILFRPFEERLSGLFGQMEEVTHHKSWGGSLVRVAILAFIIALAAWIHKLFSDNPIPATFVALQSLIIPSVMTYAWLVGANRGPRGALRRGGIAGAGLGAALGAAIVAAGWLIYLFDPAACARGRDSALGLACLLHDRSADQLVVALLTDFLHLVLTAVASAALLGFSGLAGVLVDWWWTARPRLGLALAAIAASIPIVGLVLLNPPEESCMALGAVLGGMLGWAATFYLHPSLAAHAATAREGIA